MVLKCEENEKASDWGKKYNLIGQKIFIVNVGYLNRKLKNMRRNISP